MRVHGSQRLPRLITMPTDRPPGSAQRQLPAERRETDRSLHDERKKTDQELDRRHAAIEEVSDAAVRQARGHSDEMLADARERADDTLAREGSSAGERHALRRERAEEDASLREERFIEDEKEVEDRRGPIRALASLLQLERGQTDERLLVERARGDATVAARDDFLGLVSHDLRTLLGNVALNAELLAREAASDEAGQRALARATKIQRSTMHMTRLLGDLVDVASIEAGRFAVAPNTSDTKPLVRDVLEAFRPAASAKGISLTMAAAEGVLLAKYDQDRVLQVLANLLSNAVKFTGGGGSITVNIEPEGVGVRFSVSDTGAGIEPDHLDSIFERFWQVTEGDRRGLGLGLFISRCIVEAHGGRIWAESTRGQGSTFFFTLPGAERPGAPFPGRAKRP
jgi:signal transduction histidine kinase